MSELQSAPRPLDHALAGATTSDARSFARWLVQHLARELGVHYAFAAEVDPLTHGALDTIGWCADTEIPQPPRCPVAGPVVGDPTDATARCIPRGAREHQGGDPLLAELEIEGICSLVLRDVSGRDLGVLTVGHRAPLPDPGAARLLLERFGERMRIELERELALKELHSIVEGISTRSGEEFFSALVRALARALRVRMALVAEVSRPGVAQTVAFWSGERFVDSIEYELAGTPCGDVHDHSMCLHTSGVQDEYPEDVWLAQVGAESYMGYPFVDAKGQVVGHLSVIHDRPIQASLYEDSLFRVFAAQAGAELLRRRAEEERLTIERQLLESQKLESLGMLAGGIAHDFNNLLVGITGNVSLALMDASQVSPIRPYLREIELAAQRAADLAKQMLAYSGKGRFVIAEADLSELVEEMANLLQVSIPKTVVLRYDLARDLPRTPVDATQIRQVAMNLVLNAAEAIGEKSGIVSLCTGMVRADRSYLDEASIGQELEAGDYVYLEVSDTGIGMDAETCARVFDPFFSTKPTGRGLGLAAVQGIVRGHKGALKVYSEPGRGTTFKLMLPVAGAPAGTRPDDPVIAAPALDARRVALVIDDEETVRAAAARMFERLGFQVRQAEDGRVGVELFRSHAAEIDVVLLDMTMPHLSGEEAFREIRRIDAGARVVLISGYNEQDATSRFAGKGLAGFLQKPFNVEQLSEVLNEVLA